MLFLKSIWSRYFTRKTKVLFGPGVVGKATAKVFKIKDFIDWNGKVFTGSVGSLQNADEIWICVPTPQRADGRCDISEVERVFKFASGLNKHAIYIIRSTVIPGTARKLRKKYGVDIISFPEFLSENSALQDTQNPWFCVIGGDLYKNYLNDFIDDYIWYFKDKINVLYGTNNTTAEMTKYALNSLFATLVVFANQIFDASVKAKNVDYTVLKAVLGSLPWKQQHHLEVFHKGYRGYGGRCLPKDTLALATEFNVDLLKHVHRINKNILRNNPKPQQSKNSTKGY